jgi:hypothetical protein
MYNEGLTLVVLNPEWTNLNESDPGVTLIEAFAFLTENLLYRRNQIPERNCLMPPALINSFHRISCLLLLTIEGDYPDAIIGLMLADIKKVGRSNFFLVIANMGANLHLKILNSIVKHDFLFLRIR